ncbi:MAG: thiol oxidoreductase [Rhodobiaceae bacterium]|nr:MAG: thiol oxidoreductase [Rhodobiaceae bacterium]
MKHTLSLLIALALPLTCVSNAVHAAPQESERAAILAPTTDFSVAELHENLPGGSTTNTRRFDREAFSQPSQNMSFADRGNFFIGNGFFRRLWVTAPSSTTSADGLGPVYNARACQRCHLKDGRGHPPENASDSAVSMFLRVSIPPQNAEQADAIRNHMANIVPEPTYGGQLQDIAIPGHAAEGRMTVDYQDVEISFADGATVNLRQPTYDFVDLGYGDMHPDAMFSPRIAPPMIGLGLLEAIAADDILAVADPDDADEDGISGTAKLIWSRAESRVMLARFGWKAGNATIADQSSDAMAGDIGVSNPLFPVHHGDCTESQPTCLAAPVGISDAEGAVEAPAEVMEKIFFYSRNLAVPARRNAGDPQVLRGKELFYQANCTSCHTPKHATRTDDDVEPALRGQLIWPYTDLLLHDMGEGLADGRPEGTATGSEWRTTPLWGIGFTERVNRHTYFLHDGRARNLTEAILWHGGEAEVSREAFRTMDEADRQAMITFLESL